jgi:hypothetical protein
MYDVLVCDPDEKQFEGSAIGLLYTAVSRATTFGDPRGLGSAIYFQGQSFTRDRILKLTTRSSDNKEFELARKRREWVKFLKRNAARTETLVRPLIKRNSKQLLQWITSSRTQVKQLHKRIQQYKIAKSSP